MQNARCKNTENTNIQNLGTIDHVLAPMLQLDVVERPGLIINNKKKTTKKKKKKKKNDGGG